LEYSLENTFVILEHMPEYPVRSTAFPEVLKNFNKIKRCCLDGKIACHVILIRDSASDLICALTIK